VKWNNPDPQEKHCMSSPVCGIYGKKDMKVKGVLLGLWNRLLGLRDKGGRENKEK
jgi:hypothetical protein